jgi:hypothetical protein
MLDTQGRIIDAVNAAPSLDPDERRDMLGIIARLGRQANELEELLAGKGAGTLAEEGARNAG